MTVMTLFQMIQIAMQFKIVIMHRKKIKLIVMMQIQLSQIKLKSKKHQLVQLSHTIKL